MKRKLIWITLASMTLLAGCGPLVSLHPLYTNDDLVSDARFQGKWQVEDNGDDKCVFTFHSPGKTTDELVCTSKSGEEHKAEVHLLQLSGYLFLDFTAVHDEWLLFPVHQFAKVESISPDELRIAFLGSDWLEDQIKAASFPRYERAGDNETDILLTASTFDLQEFVLTYVIQAQAFEKDATVLHRVD